MEAGPMRDLQQGVIKTSVIVMSAWIASASAATALELGSPVDCVIGKSCFIQQYVDHQPGPEAFDYRCGKATYDGHDGTDIRVRTTAESGTVAVLASAPGRVKAIRDGVEDRLARTSADKAALAGRECGNGVLVVHADGYETQYCHLRRGSVRVKPGDTVETGATLGTIGFSGDAAFPHVHFEVRRNGRTIDPFAPDAPMASCDREREPTSSLWADTARTAFSYSPTALLNLGFASGPLDLSYLEEAQPIETPRDSTAPAVVAYARAINVPEAAMFEIVLTGPTGELARNSQITDRSKAQLFLFSGKKRPAGNWPAGRYRVTVTMTGSDGRSLISAERVIELKGR
jgi:hypothetical protein